MMGTRVADTRLIIDDLTAAMTSTWKVVCHGAAGFGSRVERDA